MFRSIRDEAAFISMVMNLAGWPSSVESAEASVRRTIDSGALERITQLVAKAKAEGRSYLEVADEEDGKA